MPTYHLLSPLGVWSFFALICIYKTKSKAEGIARNLIPTIVEISEEIVIRGLSQKFVDNRHLKFLNKN